MFLGSDWLKRGLLVTMSCSALFFTACNKSGGKGVTYANSYTGAFESSASLRLLARTVNFTISWNESGASISGFYQDDYFAAAGVTVSGAITNGATSFVVNLPQELDGVATLDFVVTDSGNGTTASITGKDATGGTVFADNDVALEKKTSGSSGSGQATTVAEFFAKLAGEYDWVTSRSGGSDDQWNVGETYKVKITADKKITLPSNDGTVEIVFGADGADVFESYDHEAYIIATRGDCKYLLQHQYEANETFLTCSKGSGVSAPFWKFGAKGGTSTGVLAELGIGGAAGNHAWVVKSATAGHGTPYDTGAELKFTISEDANITTDLGDFTYSEDTFGSHIVSDQGEEYKSATWYNPSRTAVPRKQITIEADANELKSVIIRDYRGGSVGIIYVLGETL